jgi:four helix bundle protein
MCSAVCQKVTANGCQLRRYQTTREGLRLVGANYIEANEALGRNDFLMRIRIAKKEAKESAYWLRLMDCGTNEEVISERAQLVQESMELMLILAAILRKSECKPSSS